MPLNLLPHVSSNNVGHLELKNLSARTHVCSSDLPRKMFGIWGRLIYRCKGLENTFPTVYYTPQKVYKSHLQNKNKICIRLATVDQVGQKNHNEETIVILFHIVFYYTNRICSA
jgi:hypothetical protein